MRNLFLKGLEKHELEVLQGEATEVSLSASEDICEIGDKVRHLYLPSSVVFSVVTIMNDGQSVESATIGYESALGLLPILADEASLERVFVQVSGTALKVPAGVVRALAARSPGFLRHTLRFAMSNIAQAQLSVACNALHGVPQRLARWLLLTQDRIGGSFVPLTQEFLSIMLGVQRTTVTAAIGTLRHQGLIDHRRAQIIVVDRPGLEALACECYALGCDVTSKLQRRAHVAAAS